MTSLCDNELRRVSHGPTNRWVFLFYVQSCNFRRIMTYGIWTIFDHGDVVAFVVVDILRLAAAAAADPIYYVTTVLPIDHNHVLRTGRSMLSLHHSLWLAMAEVVRRTEPCTGIFRLFVSFPFDGLFLRCSND